MQIALRMLIAVVTLSLAGESIAASAPFSGTWHIDLRNPADRARGADCGYAQFVLHQTGQRIRGSHEMATVNGGRLNEGGDGTVEGSVTDQTATLRVTSGRNDAVVLGTATLKNGSLHWQITDQVKAGNPQGDDLILGEGVLTKKKRQPVALAPGSWLMIPGGTWTPDEALISDARTRLEAAVRKQAQSNNEKLPEWGSYTFQFQGRNVRFTDVIYINAFCTAPSPAAASKFVQAFDGGSCYFSAQYDPVSKTFSDIHFNGRA